VTGAVKGREIIFLPNHITKDFPPIKELVLFFIKNSAVQCKNFKISKEKS
jgi:hypothetical protein